MDIAQRIVETLASVEGVAFLVLVGALAFGESAILADLVVPGEVGMVLAGAAAAEQDLAVASVVAVAALGAVMGDTASYLIGRHVGMRAVTRWDWLRRRLEPAVERAHEHLERHGARTLFVGRWVGALRAVVPVVAGTARMPYPRFLAWNILAASTWVTTVVVLGYAFGDEMARLVDRFGLAVSAIVLTILLARFLWTRHKRKREQASGDDA